MSIDLKKEIIRILKEDEEFRYTVAGLIGLQEILKRLDRNERKLAKLREDMNKGFQRHDEILARHEQELIRLREDMNKGFQRHDEILARHEQELIRLREDMNKGFNLIERRISALGTRWGLMAEESFREGIKALLGKELDLKVERWSSKDEEGLVYGYPSDVEIDIAVKDSKIIIVEIKAHADAADIFALHRKALLYEKKTLNKPNRVLMVTPYAEENAINSALKLGIEVYTKV
ncbi:hypothetical protein HRbin06_00415 [archaeon HR06]|nr:hypothetical protein HRbin06_00414 [archaeon HR06]GBC75102.1 hypothetical protein HRbin06_00415 [archaeon HR06]